MKKLLFVVLFAVVSVYCHAQDIIVTNDGDRIECVIRSESDQEIKYTAWNDKKKTLRTIPMSSVWSVSYDDSIQRSVPVTTQPAVPQTQSSAVPDFSKLNASETFMYDQSYKAMTNPSPTTYKTKSGMGAFVFGYLGFLVFAGGGIGGGIALIDEGADYGWALLFGGAALGITSLSLGIRALYRASRTYSVVVDVPINDKFSVGLYDYALAPTQPHGAGVGVKFNF